MHEILMRNRWLIAIFLAVTLASMAAYVGNRQQGDTSPDGVVAGVTTLDNGPGVDGDAAPAALRTSEDPLIDKTIGEDVRPQEEKDAEAAALAAAAAQAKIQPVIADGAEVAVEGE